MTPFLLHSSSSKQHRCINISMPLIHVFPFYSLPPYANSMLLGMMQPNLPQEIQEDYFTRNWSKRPQFNFMPFVKLKNMRRTLALHCLYIFAVIETAKCSFKPCSKELVKKKVSSRSRKLDVGSLTLSNSPSWTGMKRTECRWQMPCPVYHTIASTASV